MFPAICEIVSAAGDWQSVLTSVSAIPDEQRRSFSWIWPTESCLEELRECFRAHGIHNVLSIGCGSGLLEWILQESCGLKVSGIELDKSWWTSAYAPVTFIPLSFTGPSLDKDFLQHCAPGEPFILLFCYFNNGRAFWDYLRRFQGDFVMIAGPRDGAGIHTDPTPLALMPENYPKEGFWTLKATIPTGDSLNIFTLYQRMSSTNVPS